MFSLNRILIYFSAVILVISPVLSQSEDTPNYVPPSTIEIGMDSMLNARGMISPDMKISIPANPNGRGFIQDVAKQAYEKFKSVFTGDMMESTFANFTRLYNRKETDITPKSKTNFLENVLGILKHNLKALSGNLMFTRGVNLFSDMTPEEVRQRYTGAIVLNQSYQTGRSMLTEDETPSKVPAYHPSFSGAGRSISAYPTAPPQMDWRTRGIVTVPKQQGACSSCTSFALTAGLESAMALYKGIKGLDLSEQDLLDCATGDGIHRCSGNWPEDMYLYQQTYGQTYDSAYPYVTRETPCQAAGTSRVANVTGFFKAPPGDENVLQNWLGIYGVHSAVVQVDEPFIQYNGGIMDVPCDNSRFDHSVLVVGYGTDPSLGMDYWIIKNSWGEFWGEAGFIRIARNRGNLCRIADYAIVMQA